MSQRSQAQKASHSLCLGFDGAITPILGAERKPNCVSREHMGSSRTTTNRFGTIKKVPIIAMIDIIQREYRLARRGPTRGVGKQILV